MGLDDGRVLGRAPRATPPATTPTASASPTPTPRPGWAAGRTPGTRPTRSGSGGPGGRRTRTRPWCPAPRGRSGLASGPGPRSPTEWRTCFERDRDRILHSAAFRRLAGKTQVFIFPDDHSRTRLTHALEVAQVATSVARACGLNVALTEAIALGHDCGHGPGGHASEDALAPFLDEGFDHARWGAEVSLVPLNLCAPVLDGIANHSWSRPAPATCEGEVVSWADRIAYVCHDWEDALATGIVSADLLDPVVASRCGSRRSEQLGAFIGALVRTTTASGRVAMDAETADALARFRAVNYEHIYLRQASVAQAEAVVVAPAGPRRALRRPAQRDPLGAGGRRAERRLVRGDARGGRLRGRDDRPLRLPPGAVGARLGPGEAAEGGRGLSPMRGPARS